MIFRHVAFPRVVGRFYQNGDRVNTKAKRVLRRVKGLAAGRGEMAAGARQRPDRNRSFPPCSHFVLDQSGGDVPVLDGTPANPENGLLSVLRG
jgi:hypothetical protein